MAPKQSNMSDHDLLVELTTDVKWLKCIMEKHLSHHSKLFWTGLGICSTVVAGLMLIIIPKAVSLLSASVS